MNLFVPYDKKGLSARGPYPYGAQVRRSEIITAPITTSRRQKEIQWLRSARLQATDWIKRGPGCPRRPFGHFSGEGKVTRVRAGQAREKGVRGRVAPEELGPGLGKPRK